ncbi:MAG: type II secretion system protein [Shewanella sp.]
MNKQKGFTLIELVVVIIILGILAVTAAPKFINLQSDARLSTLQGLKGAIQGANSLVYSKAAIAGVETTDVTVVDIGTGTDVDIAYGYLAATEDALTEALQVDFADEWEVVTGEQPLDSTGTFIGLKQVGAPETCVFSYAQATDGVLPAFSEMPLVTDC